MRKSVLGWLGVACLVGVGCASGEDDSVETQSAARELGTSGPLVSAAEQQDVLGPLREMAVNEAAVEAHAGRPLRLIPVEGPAVSDSVAQESPGVNALTTSGLNFAGVGDGDYGFSPNAAPPDTN